MRNFLTSVVRATALLGALSGCIHSLAAAQNSASLDIPEDIYLPDFSYAGYHFGQKPLPDAEGTIIDLEAYGAIADDEKDDSKAFLAALEAANAIEGPVVVALPKGRIIISEILPIVRSHIVIRGHGSTDGGSTVYFPRPLQMVGDGGRLDELREYLVRNDKRQIEVDRNINLPFSEYSWSGGFFWVGRDGSRPEGYLPELDRAPPVLLPVRTGHRGSQAIKLATADASQLSVGDWININWRNAEGKGAPILRSIYGDTELEIGSRLWSSPSRVIVSQKTKLLAIEGGEIHVADPLLHDANAQILATVEPWSPLVEVGFENFRLEFPKAVAFGHHLERGYNGIYITGVANGWARNLNFRNSDSGILTYASSNLTLTNIKFQGERYGHYAVHLGSVHNVLAENIDVYTPVEHSFTFNTKSTRSVYKSSTAYNRPVLDQHAGANHQNLFDNITIYLEAIKGDEGFHYPVFNGSGAPYWEPGHGSFNTTWNLSIVVNSGPDVGEPLEVQGLAEGPDARIIGLSGNRPLTLDYRPSPYVSNLNDRVDHIPSLYDFQLKQRLENKGN